MHCEGSWPYMVWFGQLIITAHALDVERDTACTEGEMLADRTVPYKATKPHSDEQRAIFQQCEIICVLIQWNCWNGMERWNGTIFLLSTSKPHP